ncbi:hypothetical protein MKW92_036640 [Papaver armeniacum]|nr:hypothetical protein MKW92_036640 [Papaver armeniacum]
MLKSQLRQGHTEERRGETSPGNLSHFMPIHTGAEKDLQFVFNAASLSSLLNNWSGMDMEKADGIYRQLTSTQCIILTYKVFSVQLYDGGFGLVPGLKSHGRTTYCPFAAVRLVGFIEDDVLSKGTTSSVIDVQSLLEWCLQRQAIDGGFQCPSKQGLTRCHICLHRIGGILRVLGDQNFYDNAALQEFLLTCQSKHVYFGFAAFCLLEEPALDSLCIELGITDLAVIGIPSMCYSTVFRSCLNQLMCRYSTGIKQDAL